MEIERERDFWLYVIEFILFMALPSAHLFIAVALLFWHEEVCLTCKKFYCSHPETFNIGEPFLRIHP